VLHDDSPDQLIPVEPPWIYTELAKADASMEQGGHGVPLPHPPGREAFGPFPAHISVFEVLEFSDDTNTQLEENAGDEDEEQQRRLEENAGDEDEEQQRRAEGGHPGTKMRNSSAVPRVGTRM
jgi:hypothetical protein